MSVMCFPSKRAALAGLVMDANGGRAIGCILAKGSSFIFAGSAAGAVSASAHTAKRVSDGVEPDGYFSSCVASPLGWSMRMAQVFPLPPVRVDVKNRYFP